MIEMIAGVALLAGLTRLGGYVVSAWLALIAVNLVTTGHYFDVAVRDLVMACGAFVLARLTEARELERGTLPEASRRGSVTPASA